jgi:dihydrofolate synthase/folylpolyglutamate synthase
MPADATVTTLREAESYLDGLINLERGAPFDYAALGLERIRALLEACGRPERGLPCVHVAGSKGKGTTTLAVEVLLRAAGRRVGTYTSPHLESWIERFRVDGRPVDAQRLVEGLARLQPAIEKLRADARLRPSFFDACTALALRLFADLRVDAGSIEVGLGGRLDSTNVVESRVSLITALQLEHTDKLGATLEAIAAEKAGILRPGVPALVGPLPAPALAVVRERARVVGAPLREIAAPRSRSTAMGLCCELADGRRLRAPVLGAHQAANLALAVAAAEEFLGRALRAPELGALEKLELPGRIERLGDAILDCAHTPDAARALRRALQDAWPGRRWALVLCISRDKDARGVLDELAGPARVCVATAAEPLRSLEPAALAALAREAGIDVVDCEPEPRAALARAQALARPGELLVVTGSVYLAGALRAPLREAARP